MFESGYVQQHVELCDVSCTLNYNVLIMKYCTRQYMISYHRLMAFKMKMLLCVSLAIFQLLTYDTTNNTTIINCVFSHYLSKWFTKVFGTMEPIQEETKPPILDGLNYSYRKSRMTKFLKSIDSKSRKAVVTGWEHPIVINAIRKVSLRPEITWSNAEDKACLLNSRALNAIFNEVDQNSTSVKEA